MINQSPIEELIAFMIDNEGKIDVNDVLIKAELINMRSRPRHVGWYFNNKFYRDIDELNGYNITSTNAPKPLYYYPL